MPRLALVITAACLCLLLGSCTRDFRVTAAFVDRSLVFLSEDDRPTRQPWCWDRLTISDVSGEPIWEFEVPPGAYRNGERCGPNFPLRYGRLPPHAQLIIPARRLQEDRLYVVSGSAGGMLEGAFVLRERRGLFTIENVDPSSAQVRQARDRNAAWVRRRSPGLPDRSAGRPAADEPFMIPNDATIGVAGSDRYTWLLNAGPRDNFPSLSYATMDERQILFDLWCRYRGAVIYVRMTDPNLSGSRFTLLSGQFQSTGRLSGPGDPETPFRAGAVLAEDEPVLRNFGLTGRLAMRLPDRQLALDAVSQVERGNIQSFFEQCYFARETEPGLPW